MVECSIKLSNTPHSPVSEEFQMSSLEVKESSVDVLVIGAGPAGLMCAHGLAQAGINVRIIDKRPAQVAAGQAGSVNPRTIEVMQSCGLADRLIREGNRLYVSVSQIFPKNVASKPELWNETYYKPGPNGIERAGEAVTIAHPKARYPYNISLSQSRIEDIFLDSMRSLGITVDRPVIPTCLELSEDTAILKDPNAYAVKAVLESSDAGDSQCQTEIVHAKFVVGCDGAHSWVRKSLGIAMEGEQTEFTWGAVDIVPDTDFPDVRKISMIRSDNGSCMIIPRENDMIRLYMQLSDADLDSVTGQANRNKMDPEKLLEVARKSLHPYKMGNPKGLIWWTVYMVGQRLASEFSVKDRIFIAGDACHTHSPKAGQGMNASINDAHNLVWKIALVLRGWGDLSLLQTYAFERRQFAQDLIAIDKIWATNASSGAAAMANPVSLQQIAAKYRGFVSGVGIRYSESAIVDTKHQSCARNLIIGERVPPQILICVADARPYELQDLLPADTRFKILIFTGNITDEAQRARVEELAQEMEKPDSFLKRFSGGMGQQQVFDVYAIGSGKKEVMNSAHLPALFRHHWSKVLVDDLDTTGTQGGKAYITFGIESSGAVVVVRPDGYVGAISPFDSVNDLDEFFASFMSFEL